MHKSENLANSVGLASVLDKLVPFRLLQELAKMSQRGFKDGTNFTRDYCNFAGLYTCSCFFFVLSIAGMNGIVVIGLIFLILGVLVIGCRPYQRMIHNVLDFFILVTISTYTSTLIIYLARISSNIILFLLPTILVYMLAYYSG